MAGTVWDEVLGRIETKVNRYSYYTWFRQTSLARDDGQILTIRVTDPMAVEWLTKHYAVILDEALAEVGRPGVQLRFAPDSNPEVHDEARRLDARAPALVAHAPPPPSLTASESLEDEPVDLVGLSPRY